LKASHTNFQLNIGIGIHTFEADCNSYAKTSAGNIRTSCLTYAHKNIVLTWELVLDTLEATLVRMPKMMLSATQTSCLKYSRTNLQRYIEIGTRYVAVSLSLYVKK
jgi:hypothetical protein